MEEKFSWEESSVEIGIRNQRRVVDPTGWRDAFCDIVPNRFREGRDGGSPVLLRASNLGFRVSIFEGWVTSRTAISRAASNSVGRLRLSGVVVIFCDVFLSPDASVRAERGGSSLLGVWRESHEASGSGLIQDLTTTLFGPKACTRGCWRASRALVCALQPSHEDEQNAWIADRTRFGSASQFFSPFRLF